MTFGHLAGELVRRVSGKELMEYLHDNILDPLEVSDFFIGLPDSVTDSDGKLVPFDQSRVADLVDGDGATDAGTPGSFNRPEVRRAVIPSANGETPRYRSRLGAFFSRRQRDRCWQATPTAARSLGSTPRSPTRRTA